ncbi:MAG: ABC-2 transporter permease [Candidatus Ventricola sp.]
MKGILLKDMMTLKRTMLLYLVLIVFFAVSNGGSGAAFAMFYSIAMPVNMIAVDERSRFDRLMPMLPVRRIDCVLDKYIGAWGCLALAAVLGIVGESVKAGALVLSPVILPAVAVCLVSQAITLPLLFKFGVDQGRMIYMIAIIVMAGLLGALGSLIDGQFFVPAQWLTALALLAGVALNAGSILVSERVYLGRLTA